MNNNELIDKLSNLQLQETSLKRQIDNNDWNKEERTRLFNKLNKTREEIEKTKFKLSLERKIKNENNNTK